MKKNFVKGSTYYLGLGLLLFTLGFSTLDWIELIIFFSMIPFLRFCRKSQSKIWWLMLWLTLILANLINLLWLYNTVSFFQYVVLSLIFSGLQLIPFLCFKVSNNDKYSLILFISSWIAIELFLLHSEINFPMALLGLGTASIPTIIQWWEFTGILGGTLWILLINVTFYKWIEYRDKKYLYLGGYIFIIPSILSLITFSSMKNGEISIVKCYVVGTNLPCEDVKYNLNPRDATNQLCNLTLEVPNIKDDESRIILFPETALLTPKYSNDLFDEDYQTLRDSKIINANSMILSGGFLKRVLDFNSNRKLEGVRYEGSFKNEKYLLYNAFFAYMEDSCQYRVKEKLVPFNETLPYFNILSSFSAFTYTGPYHFSKFENKIQFYFKGLYITPLICYESFNGNFVRKFAKEHKPTLIFIGLNEGWYNSNKGFKLSQKHAIARAIENRKSVLKSSNCGYSSYIKPNGVAEIVSNTNGFSVFPEINSSITFYQQKGDYIGFFALTTFFLTSLVLLVKRMKEVE